MLGEFLGRKEKMMIWSWFMNSGLSMKSALHMSLMLHLNKKFFIFCEFLKYIFIKITDKRILNKFLFK